ncbi:MAG TPA: ABC transporter permease [Candidatus Methylomirabilis sp.]|nr:ABC transporter permease [Candidatus Methylomirabilis sp.]
MSGSARLLALPFLGILFVLSVLTPILPLPSPRAMTARPLQSPSAAHVFGTDDLGRDVFSRVLWGARISLVVGLASAAIATLVGTIVGALAGYAGGGLDRVLMRITDASLVLPTFVLILIVVAIFGANVSKVILIIGFTSWPQTARVARAEFLSLREREFVLAARSCGSSASRIVWRHLLPNALPPILVTATLRVGTAILTEASLGFLGASDPNAISWGQLLLNALQVMRDAWWTVAFPGLAISLTILALNSVGDMLAGRAVVPGQ